jgi:uncharacterized protein YqfB (UPF0267 family)
MSIFPFKSIKKQLISIYKAISLKGSSKTHNKTEFVIEVYKSKTRCDVWVINIAVESFIHTHQLFYPYGKLIKASE